MSKVDNGGPAFPGPWMPRGAEGDCATGMTLRDWFAGQALVGYWADQSEADDDFLPEGMERTCENAAEFAYRQADAMLAARKGV